MNLAELQHALDVAGIRSDAYNLDAVPYEGHAMQRQPVGLGEYEWIVFYAERGKRNSPAVFQDESDACQELYDRLLKDQTTREPAPTHMHRWWRRR